MDGLWGERECSRLGHGAFLVGEAGEEVAKKAVKKVMGLGDREMSKMGRKIMNRVCKLLKIDYCKGPVVVNLDSE